MSSKYSGVKYVLGIIRVLIAHVVVEGVLDEEVAALDLGSIEHVIAETVQLVAQCREWLLAQHAVLLRLGVLARVIQRDGQHHVLAVDRLRGGLGL